ncbi:hypothetical protein EGR_11155 [Echinococcus granulosus]|uniref:Uncharacterized protein n=1 Tax=Echinococcus granulosus TaxID=6210 RepID=W6UKH6_ECHGR|nr:hypothetical protein EGR_11155 [Echinococcus granulosus]EUB53989.1 hypothetical protein EGR_11155 [Echinococcus granulosus]
MASTILALLHIVVIPTIQFIVNAPLPLRCLISPYLSSSLLQPFIPFSFSYTVMLLRLHRKSSITATVLPGQR